MKVLEAYLDARESRPADRADWQRMDQPPEVRLQAFDRWVRRELAERLDWAWAGSQREKRLEQCRLYLERIVLDLWRRGWLLDGRALAQRLRGVLEVVGAQQRAGKVRAFWPYFRATVDRYVGVNSEEIQEEARRVGAHVGQLLSDLLKKSSARASGDTLPELLARRAGEVAEAKAETLRARASRLRRQEKAAKAQPELPL